MRSRRPAQRQGPSSTPSRRGGFVGSISDSSQPAITSSTSTEARADTPPPAAPRQHVAGHLPPQDDAWVLTPARTQPTCT
jgi:hypothetical protein